MIRSKLWQPEAWPNISALAPLAEVIVAHAGVADAVDEVHSIIERDTRERLY
jgi:hypothetical protein